MFVIEQRHVPPFMKCDVDFEAHFVYELQVLGWTFRMLAPTESHLINVTCFSKVFV